MGPVGPMLFLFDLTSQLVSPNLLAQGSVIDGRCDNLFDGWRLAMSSLDKMLGWFPHTRNGRTHHSGCAAVAADDDGHIGA